MRPAVRGSLLWALAFALAPASAAHAVGVSIVGQTRSVFADGIVYVVDVDTAEETDARDAEDFSGFNQEANADAAVAPSGFAIATGNQDSEINELVPDEQLEAFGAGAAGMAFDILDQGFDSSSAAAGDSFFELVFTLDEPAQYSLVVSLSAALDELSLFSGPGPIDSLVGAFFGLSGTTTGLVHESTIRDESVDDTPVEDFVSVAGVLAPDTYTLQVGAAAEGSGFEDAAGSGVSAFGFDFVVSVPEPGAGLQGVVAVVSVAFLGLWRRRRSYVVRAGAPAAGSPVLRAHTASER